MAGQQQGQHKSDTTVSDNPTVEICLEPMIRRKSPDAPLLDDRTAHLPQDWPTGAKPIKRSIGSVLSGFAVDIVLLALSLAFFAFGLIVKHYDQAPTALHQHATDTLLSATKYVCRPNLNLSKFSNSYLDRAQPYFQFFSHVCLVGQHTPSWFGV